MAYPMGYPQMMPMQQGYHSAAVAAPPPAAVTEAPELEAAESDIPAVRLPNPEETGAKPAAPPAAAGAKKEEKPSTSAADIIKQYMNRRS